MEKSRKRMLIIDNTARVTERIEATLPGPFETVTIPNAMAALVYLASERFDVVVCTEDMPDMPEAEFCYELANNGCAETPRVLFFR